MTLFTKTMVKKIRFHGTHAVGIDAEKSAGPLRIDAKKEVIVCSGAVGSPQLLQVSGVGPTKDLSALGIETVIDNPNVGGHLQDHLAINYYFEATKPTLNNQLSSLFGKILAGMKYIFANRGPLSLSVNQCGGFLKADPKSDTPDTQIYFSPLTYGQHDPSKNSRVNPDPFAGFLLSFQPCRPTSEGCIDICSADINVPPKIKPNSLATQNDLDAVVHGGRILQTLAATSEMQKLIKRSVDVDLQALNDTDILADFRQRCSTVFHPVATCRMGVDPTTNVVGLDMKVHGLTSLRVIDASVFPTVTSGNTNAPTMMLAHKAASDMLAENQSKKETL